MIAPETGSDETSLQTVGDWIRYAASRFNQADLTFGHGTANAADEARALVYGALALDFDSPDYFLAGRVTGAEARRIAGLLDRRVAERRPLPYLTGEAWFCGLRFFVDERVLIPRSPIAELIANGFAPWLRADGELRVLDMCTGSGCIAIACALYLDATQVDAVDVDGDALAVARENVARHGLTDVVRLVQSDLFAGLDGGPYDLIVCNPPYVSTASVDALPPEYGHEPRAALQAGADGLAFVERLLADAASYLAEDGIMVVEVGESAAAFVAAYPGLPVTWCEFERGGDGVFVIEAAALAEFARDNAPSHGRSIDGVR